MSNVFGLPVTNATVQELFPGISASNITARQRAEVALLHINKDNKAQNALVYVNLLSSFYGNGTRTLVCIYNATGGNLTFDRSHSWEGTLWGGGASYPRVLQNGQWGAVLHVQGRLNGPSKEAIVYRGQNNNGASRDWVLAWNTAPRAEQNNVYTEVRSGGSTVNWDVVNNNMNNQGRQHSVATLGCFSSVSVGYSYSPMYTGIMTLDVSAAAMALASDISPVFPSLDPERKDDEAEAAAAAPAPPPPPAAAAE